MACESEALAARSEIGNELFFGRCLLETVADSAPWADWLEAAVLAGYVPYFQGIELALRACHIFGLRHVQESVWLGLDDDAIKWTRASDLYREWIALLELFVVEMEGHGAAIAQRTAEHYEWTPAPKRNGSDRIVSLNDVLARTASLRAARSLARLASDLKSRTIEVTVDISADDPPMVESKSLWDRVRRRR